MSFMHTLRIRNMDYIRSRLKASNEGNANKCYGYKNKKKTEIHKYIYVSPHPEYVYINIY